MEDWQTQHETIGSIAMMEDAFGPYYQPPPPPESPEYPDTPEVQDAVDVDDAPDTPEVVEDSDTPNDDVVMEQEINQSEMPDEPQTTYRSKPTPEEDPEVTPEFAPVENPEEAPQPGAEADEQPSDVAADTADDQQPNVTAVEHEAAPAPPPTVVEQPAPTAPVQKQPPRLIAMMNQKGGVGKTTTAVNLGAALAEVGKKVLLIDLDPQAHLTLWVGINPDELERSVYDLLVDDDVTANDVVHHVTDNLDAIPAEVSLAGAETELAPRMATGLAQRILYNKVMPLVERGEGTEGAGGTGGTGGTGGYDFVIVDCPPSLGLLTINSLVLCREVFVPMQAHFLALQGLSKLFETVSLIRQSFNPKLLVTGIICCMHEGQTNLANEVVSDVTNFLEGSREQDVPWKYATVLTPPIRRNIKLAEAPSFGQTIFDYAPHCPGARDYERLAASVLAQDIPFS